MRFVPEKSYVRGATGRAEAASGPGAFGPAEDNAREGLAQPLGRVRRRDATGMLIALVEDGDTMLSRRFWRSSS